MNKRNAILLQRLVAGVFLALFLFIHAAKLLHHHDSKKAYAKEISFGKHIVSKTDCAICDYYFVKDSHAETASIHIDSPVLFSALYTGYLTRRLTSIGLSTSDRGPPSLV